MCVCVYTHTHTISPLGFDQKPCTGTVDNMSIQSQSSIQNSNTQRNSIAYRPLREVYLTNTALRKLTPETPYILYMYRCMYVYIYIYIYIQGVPGGKVNILGGYVMGHSKQKTLYEHVSYSLTVSEIEPFECKPQNC